MEFLTYGLESLAFTGLVSILATIVFIYSLKLIRK
jgi:hypothetical protein